MPAISFNSSQAIGETTAASTTDAITVPVLNSGLAVVGIEGDLVTGNDDLLSVTLGGVAMVAAPDKVSISADRYGYFYYLLNPPSGTQNIIITFNSSHIIGRVISYYEGVNQSGQPNAHNKGTTATGTATPLAVSAISNQNNCWGISYAKSGGGTLAAGSGTILRSSSNGFAIADTNGPITPAGTVTINLSNNTNQDLECILLVFTPDTTVKATNVRNVRQAVNRANTY